MIVLDTEASGTDPYKHSLVSVGALDLSNPNNQFYAECRIWEGAHIMDEALLVNGFSKEEIIDSKKKSSEEVTREFIEWAMKIEDHTTAGQNPSFDRDFLRVSAERFGISWPLAYRTIDLHTACYMHMVKWGVEPPLAKGHSGVNSKVIMEYVGIPEEPKPHNALMGAKVAAEALSRLLYDKKFLPEFKSFDIPWLLR